MKAACTHDVTFSETEVRKRYVEWDRGEADREWACLSLLALHAPGVAPRPLRRETEGDAPVIVMERLPGVSLGEVPLTPSQTLSLGGCLRRLYEVPYDVIVEAGIPERLYGPSTLPRLVAEWLGEPHDVTRCRDAALVVAARQAAVTWLETDDVLPAPELTVLGIADLNPANVIWNGQRCRLVDFEDGGLTDPAYELADHTEHLAGRLGRPGRATDRRVVDPDALVDAVGLASDQRERMQRYRPMFAAFWLAILLPGNGGGFEKNPAGTTEAQAQHLLRLVG